MSSNKNKSGTLSNNEIDPKVKLAFLWTSLMFLYIYADYFRLMTPGKLEHMINLKTPMGPTTPRLLMIFSAILIIPALMIAASALLPPKINKWLNIVVALIYACLSLLIITSAMGDQWQLFFMTFNIIEVIVFVCIIAIAWKWPTVTN